ncbi:MAG: flagellar biosynthetic protein FliO [Alphaproteobacteria bacterium]
MTQIDYIQAIVALLFVLCLIWLLAFGVKRYAPGTFVAGRQRRLQIVESLPLGGRHRAVLLRCESRQHLLVVSEDRATLIDRDVTASEKGPSS